MPAPSETSLNHDAMSDTGGERRQGLIAAGGMLGAFAAASCCILPLTLTLFGVSGAWMTNLTALAPYQPIVVALTFAALGYGFYLVYWKARKPCVDGAICAHPLPNKLVIGSLWLATAIVVAATTFAFWFPLIEPYLP